MHSRTIRLLLFLTAIAVVIVRLVWDRQLAMDELEFFRATRWVAEGKVPFRDFWEHHLPLQWFAFAPAAGLFGGGSGAASVIAMRWAQLPCWIALFAILYRLMRRGGLTAEQSYLGLLLLATSVTFTLAAIEFRVDTLGNLGYIAALAAALLHPRSRRAWLGFGALMSLAVLANMRLAPLVVFTAALSFLVRPDERRWRWNGMASWMIAGVGVVALSFLAWLMLSGAARPFMDAMHFNLVTDRIVSGMVETFAPLPFEPFRIRDVSGALLWIGAVAGTIAALRRIKEPAVLQVLAILAVASVFFVWRLGVHYIYHFETSFILFAPLTAALVTPQLCRVVAPAVVALAIVINCTRLFTPEFGARLRYQDSLMRAVHARTLPGETVFDAVGYAIHRRPAYRYWFIPAGVRFVTEAGLGEAYAAREMAAAPPAAIVFGRRTLRFMSTPAGDSSRYAMRHYIPVYRDLWLPGLNARIDPAMPRFVWIVPRDGTYRLHASELLARHPWFSEPIVRALTGENAQRFVVPLGKLPPADLRRARITVDGVPLTSRVVALRKGQRVELQSAWPRPVGVVFAPADVTELFVPPDVSFVM